MTNSPTGAAACASSGAATSGSVTTGHPPNMHLPMPTISSVKIETMNAYVGTAKSVPDSLTPRRFVSVISTTNPTASSTR